MAKTAAGIGARNWVAPAKNKRRSKPKHLRGSKSLGPKSDMKGSRNRY